MACWKAPAPGVTGEPSHEIGMTLTELLVLVVVVGILVAIVLSLFNDYRSRAWNQHPQSDLRIAVTSALSLPEGSALSNCLNDECKTKYPGTILSECTQLALYATSEQDLTGLACCRKDTKTLGTRYYVYSSVAGKIIELPFASGTNCQLSVSQGSTGSGSSSGTSTPSCPSGTILDPSTNTCQFTASSTSSSGMTSSSGSSTGTGTSSSGGSTSSSTTSSSTSSSGTASSSGTTSGTTSSSTSGETPTPAPTPTPTPIRHCVPPNQIANPGMVLEGTTVTSTSCLCHYRRADGVLLNIGIRPPCE